MSDLVGNPEDRFSHNEAYMTWMGLVVMTETRYPYLLINTFVARGKPHSYFMAGFS